MSTFSCCAVYFFFSPLLMFFILLSSSTVCVPFVASYVALLTLWPLLLFRVKLVRYLAFLVGAHTACIFGNKKIRRVVEVMYLHKGVHFPKYACLNC